MLKGTVANRPKQEFGHLFKVPSVCGCLLLDASQYIRSQFERTCRLRCSEHMLAHVQLLVM